MPASAIDLVRALYVSVEQGAEMDVVGARLADDVVWRLPKAGALRRPKKLARGRELVAVALGANHGEVVADEYAEAGDRVVVVFRGVHADPADAPVYCQVVTVRDGAITELQDFIARDEALAAVGLDPAV